MRSFCALGLALTLMSSNIFAAIIVPLEIPVCPEILLRNRILPSTKPVPFFTTANIAAFLKPKNGEAFDPRLFLALKRPIFSRMPEGMIEGVQLDLFYNGDEVGRCQYHLRKDALRFDIRLTDAFKGQGFYEAMLAHAVHELPATEVIPSRMVTKHSSSARQIFKSAFGSALAKPRLMVELMDKEQIQNARKKILDAVEASSIFRARAANGFARLTRVIIAQEGGEVGLYFEKGEKIPKVEIKVLIQGVESVELLANGTWDLVKDESQLTLGNYVEEKYADTIEILN